MRHGIGLLLRAMALAGVVATLPGVALAQQKPIKEQLVGTWIFVSSVTTAKDGGKTEPWGANPKGTLMFDGNGRFAQVLARADLPKLVRRSLGSPKQDRAIVRGSLGAYGTYTVDEASKTLNLHTEGSSFAAFNDSDAKRAITAISADELIIVNPATRDGAAAEFKWRRAK